MARVISINPTTEEIFGELEEDSDSTIAEKVSNAMEDKSWGKKLVGDRARIIGRLVDLLEENKEDLARTMAMEMGKPIKAGRHEIDIAKKNVTNIRNIKRRLQAAIR